jgi:hypothetical protein
VKIFSLSLSVIEHKKTPMNSLIDLRRRLKALTADDAARGETFFFFVDSINSSARTTLFMVAQRFADVKEKKINNLFNHQGKCNFSSRTEIKLFLRFHVRLIVRTFCQLSRID